jgi:hypothetical protein
MNGQRVRVVRADDLLVCELELVGLTVTGTPPNRVLEAATGASTRRLILHVPPQNIAEEAFVARGDQQAMIVVRDAAGANAAGPSRVAFEVPASMLPVPFALRPVLELLQRCALSIPVTARSDPGPDAPWFVFLWYWLNPPELAVPEAEETALELPFRLLLSPDERAGFEHATEPVRAPGSSRAELWHMRLRADRDKPEVEQRGTPADMRAVWMRRGNGPPWSPTVPKWADDTQLGDREPFRHNAISQRNRHDIVHVSANRRYANQTNSDFFPSPFAVHRLAVSSLGAWLTSRGEWRPPTATTPLLEWTHRATQGRDHFVRIVEAGFLYPFCHLAALITITERKFASVSGEPAALFTRKFIAVRQPVRHYPPGVAPARQAHTMPFRTIEVRTLVTPDLEIPDVDPNCFLITRQGAAEPLLFQLRGTDAPPDNHTLDFVSPLVFVLSTSAWDKNTILKAKGLYDTAMGHEIAAGGALLALAPGTNGDTTYPAETLVFAAPPWDPFPTPPTGPPADDQPAFWPELVRARVRAPALHIVAGQNDAVEISYHETYRTNGLGGSNRGEVVAGLTSGTLPLPFGNKGDRAGGLLQPSMAVSGLSRRLGPVGGAGALAEMAVGTFDPKNFFAGAPQPARLFGVFLLDQVLARITGSSASDTPRIVTQGGADALVARVEWTPTPQSYPPTNSIFFVKDGTHAHVAVTIDARGGAPRSEIETTFEHFEIHLVPPTRFIEVAFNQITFVAQAGRKPDLDVELGEVRFVGPLSFVNELKKLIPLDGFTDPPALEVTPAGITSRFSLALPSLPLGVFALQNLSLGAGFAIPFTQGALTVSFNFCKREEPFLLTVSLFGGGGFFALTIDPNGVQTLEAALEFGASCEIDLGVAQGGVHVMAGIYFKVESAKGVTLTGYFRMGGNMSVIGLISVSIELYLGFSYLEPGKAVGRATVTVEIEIFMFSTSVAVVCERRFAGSAGDPSFRELMGPDASTGVRPWTTYCKAFA